MSFTTWNLLPDTVKVAIIAAAGVILTALVQFINKIVDYYTNRLGKQTDDAMKLREEFLERIKHLEGRLDQMTAVNLTLTAQNSEIKVRMEVYDEDRRSVRQELMETRSELETTLQEVESLKQQILIQDETHSIERETWQHRIKELEGQVEQLEASQRAHHEISN